MIDEEALERLHRLGGEVLVGRMIEIFLTNAPQRLEAARQGALLGDLKAVEQAVHSLKSSAGNLGAERLQDLAEAIEERAERNEGGEVGGLLDELESALAQVLTRLEEVQKGLTR